MNNNYLTIWIDLEVTSFDSKKGAITQISAIIERKGEEEDRINLYINPTTYNRKVLIEKKNLARSNRTLAEVVEYPASKNQFKLFLKFIENNLKENETLQLAGHNVTAHDSLFIQSWFKDNEHNMYEYFNYEYLDTLHLARHMRKMGKMEGCKDNKLKTLVDFFGIKLENWHNSMEDIQANFALYAKMQEKL